MYKEVGKEFLEKTKPQFLNASDQMKGFPPPPLEASFDSAKKIIDLPDPRNVTTDSMDLRKSIEKRRSLRTYSRTPLTIEELSYLLWCTQGVKEVYSTVSTFRTVPSAGARHAIETYLLVNNIQNLPPGLYRFLAIEHKLVELNIQSDIADKITRACLGQNFVKASAVTFIWTAVAYRMVWRYTERGYRYLFLDAGHVCQNLYLSAESLGCGVCAIAAFSDDALNEILSVDGKKQFVIYLATLGKKMKARGDTEGGRSN